MKKENENEKQKEVKKQEVEQEEMDEEFVDKKSKVSKVINVVLWVVLIMWMGICVFDFVRVKMNDTPIFCVNKTTKDYSDGSVERCIGLGYKVYHYKREAIKAVEFKPLWAKERLSDLK